MLEIGPKENEVQLNLNVQKLSTEEFKVEDDDELIKPNPIGKKCSQDRRNDYINSRDGTLMVYHVITILYFNYLIFLQAPLS